MKVAAMLAVAALASACYARQQSSQDRPTDGCGSCSLAAIAPNATLRLRIRWKRAVDDQGATIAAHRKTEHALNLAHEALKKALTPLGIEVILEKVELSNDDFHQNPLKSNRLWLNGAAIFSYLPNARSGTVEIEEIPLRTIEFAGQSFRDLTPELIVYAGLAAANDSVQEVLADTHARGVANPPAAPLLINAGAPPPSCGSSDLCDKASSCGDTATPSASSCCETDTTEERMTQAESSKESSP